MHKCGVVIKDCCNSDSCGPLKRTDMKVERGTRWVKVRQQQQQEGTSQGNRGVKIIKIHPIHVLRYHDETHCRQLIYTSERIEVRES